MGNSLAFYVNHKKHSLSVSQVWEQWPPFINKHVFSLMTHLPHLALCYCLPAVFSLPLPPCWGSYHMMSSVQWCYRVCREQMFYKSQTQTAHNNTSLSLSPTVSLTVLLCFSLRLVLRVRSMELSAFRPRQLHKRQLSMSSYVHRGALPAGLFLPLG